MAASVVQLVSGAFAGAYAPNVNYTGTTTAAADAVLLFFASHSSSITAPLQVTVDGKAMTLAGQDSPANGGTIWSYVYFGALPAGSHTVNVQCANTYIDVGQAEILFLVGTSGLGAVDAKQGGGTAMTTSVVTTDANSLVLTGAFGYYTGGTLTLTGSTPTATSIPITTQPDTNQVCALISQPGTGAAVTSSWSVPYNQVVGIAVEIKGVAGSGGSTGGGSSTPATSTGTSTASLKATSAEAGQVQVTGTQAANLALTNGGETATTVANNASTGNFALTSADTGQVAVTGTQAANLKLTAVETNSQESAPLALADAGTRYSIARTGAGCYRDGSGVMQQVAANAARLENHRGVPLGIMVEDASTNLVRDSQASAAVANGALPAGASFYNGGLAGCTCTVVGTGVEDGVDYVDLRFQGNNTGSSTVYPGYSMSGATDCPVAASDNLVLSAYMRVTAGSVARPADGYPMVSLGINTYDTSNAYVASLPLNPPLLNTDKLTRDWLATSVPSSGASAYAVPQLAINIPAGVTLDCTVRLGLPQMEKARTYPSTPIKTNGTAGVARGAESMTYLTAAGTKDIQVEYCDVTGKRTITTYSAQNVGSSGWPVPAVAQTPYVRRISSSATLAARSTAVQSATAKAWNLGVAFKLSDYTNNSDYAALIVREAAIYCPEYEFKMDQLQTSEGTFAFTVADNFAAQATNDNKKLRGHCLIWYAATPTWAQNVLTGSPTTARWQGLIDSHIKNVVNRWTQVTTWDVANECFEPTDGISGGYRNSVWYQGCGATYIAYAFQRAKAYNTTAKLHLAEYGLEENDTAGQNRRTAVLNWLTSAKQNGVPVDGLSLQCHLDLERPFSASAYTSFLQSVQQLGVNIIVTELDVRAPVNYNTIGYDLKARDRVRAVLDCIVAVTGGTEILCWDYTDKYTWLTAQFPSRTERPTPFDTTNAPKAMYAALQEEFESVAPTAGSTSSSTSTGTQSANLAMTAVQAGNDTATGTSTAGLKLTAAEAGAVAATGSSSGNFAATSAEAGGVAATGSSTAGMKLTAVDVGTDPVLGQQTATLALTSVEAAQVQVTGVGAGNCAVTASEAGSAAATGQSTGALAFTDGGEAGQVQATGQSSGNYALTAADAGQVQATGVQAANLSMTASEAATGQYVSTGTSSGNLVIQQPGDAAGQVQVTGTSTSADALTAAQSGSAVATGTSTAGFAMTGSGAGVVAVTGAQAVALALTAMDGGSVSIAGQEASSVALTAIQAGSAVSTGQGAGNLVLTNSANGSAAATAMLASSVVITAAALGVVTVSGISSVGLALASMETGTEPAQGAGSGAFVITSSEQATGQYVSTGSSSASLALTAMQGGAVAVAGSSAGSFITTAAETGTAPATGASAGAFVTTSSGETGTVTASGQQSATLALAAPSTEFGAVTVTGQQSANDAMTASQSGIAPSTGTLASTLCVTSAGAGTITATGASNAPLLLTSADSGSVSITGASNAGAALTSIESGSAPATAQTTGRLSLSSAEAGGAAATGTSTAPLALTGAGTSAAAVTGSLQGAFQVTAAETGGVVMGGQGTGNFALTSYDTSSASAQAYSIGGMNVTGQGSGTVSDAGTQTVLLAVTGSGTGTVAATAACMGGFVLTSSQTGALACTGTSSSLLACQSLETGSAIPLTTGVSTSALLLTGSSSGSLSIVGSSAAGMGMTALDAGAVAITGQGTGGFALTSFESVTAVPISQGAGAGGFVLTAADTAAIGVSGSGAGSFAFTGNEASTVQVGSYGAGGFVLMAQQTGVGAVAGTGATTLALASTAAATVALTGQGAGSLGLTSAEVGGALAQGSSAASLAFQSQEWAGVLSPIGGIGTGFFALASSQMAAVQVTATLAPGSFRFGQSQMASNPIAGQQQATFGLAGVDLGTVLMVGQGSGTWLFSGVEWSRQTNPGVMVSGFGITSETRGVFVYPGDVSAVSGRKAVAGAGGGGARMAVAPKVGSSPGATQRVAKAK